MSATVERICVRCGQRNPVSTETCPRCGALADRPWLAKAGRALPARRTETGLALAAGSAMVLRLAWRLWRNRKNLAHLAKPLQSRRAATPGTKSRLSGRPLGPRVHIHRGWAWGDRSGLCRWGVDYWRLETDE